MEEEGTEKAKAPRVDPAWEFAAPKYYDFYAGETDDERKAAEYWFASATSHDASPHAGKSKPVVELLNIETQEEDMEEVEECTSPDQNKENHPDQRPAQLTTSAGKVNVAAEPKSCEVAKASIEASNVKPESALNEAQALAPSGGKGIEVSPCTPLLTSQDGAARSADRIPFSMMATVQNSPGNFAAKRLHSEGCKDGQASQPATMATVTPSSGPRRSSGKKKESKPASVHKVPTPGSPDKPANKKQKLEGGRLRQIKERVVRPPEFHQPTLTRPQEFKFCTEKRSRAYGGADTAATAQAGRAMSPFVSMAEKVRLFQCKTPERFHLNPSNQHDADDQEKRRLKLTRPRTPDLETSHRVVRRVMPKSTAEMEVEELAKVPQFKARPAPKKILEAPPPPLVHKSTPVVPEFQEFHFRTFDRALQHKGVERLDESANSSQMGREQKRKCAPDRSCLVEPRDPHLHTANRARPFTVKSREEIELEELAKVPKFKARPLNKRIFESRGDLGVFRNNKREVTIPQEFHFATDERLQPRESSLLEQFGNMCLNKSSAGETTLRTTIPEPFDLLTESRGVVKEMAFLQGILMREQQEMEARIPKAHPLPFTTDVPDVPPKPETKECTRPEPFELESCIRHEEHLQRVAEEQQKTLELETAMTSFQAHPINSVGPVFVPARSRKPLTEVHEFFFHSDTRAVERAEFDQRVNEKHNQYKRFREEYEAARKAEEERSIKALRRDMVPHARTMPTYNRPFIPQRSTKELTRPVSPQFNLPSVRLPSTARRRSSATSTASFRKRMGMR